MKNFLISFAMLFTGCEAFAAVIQTANFPTVQAAINAAQQGDTVQFSNRDYGAVPSISLKSGLKYDGNGARLSGNPVFPFNSLSDIEIKNFTLSGTGLTGVSLKNAKIHDNIFNLGSNGLGIYLWVSAPSDGCKINPAACNAAMPVTASNVVIERNDFYGTPNYTGQNEGIHVRFDTPAPPGPDLGPGKSTGFIFRNNRMRNISRCGGEFQGGGTGSLFEDNIFEAPTFSNNQNVNSGSMGLSLAMDASVGNIARRNKIDGGNSRQVDGLGVRNGIEGSGHGYIATDNWIHNVGNAADINNAHDNPQIINNNMANNASDAVAAQMGGRSFTIANNGPNVVLSWDVSRAWPLGSVVTPPICSVDSPNDTYGLSICLGGHSYSVINGHVGIDGQADNGTTALQILLHAKAIYQVQSGGVFWVASVNPPKVGTPYVKVSDPRCVEIACSAGCAPIVKCP